MVGDDNVSGYAAFDYMSGYNYKNGGSVIDGEIYDRFGSARTSGDDIVLDQG